MGQQTGSELEKKYIKAVYCHPAYLTYMQSTSCETLGCMKLKTAGRNIKHLRYADDTTLMAESKEELQSLLKQESEKVGSKLIERTTLRVNAKPSYTVGENVWYSHYGEQNGSFSKN